MSDDEGELFEMLELMEKMEPEGANFDRELKIDDFDPPVNGLFTIYRDEIYSLQILLSRTQARPGRTVKQVQEEISPNHVQRINLISVVYCRLYSPALLSAP